ncbi:MAG: LysR family transcriptional regulator [Oscillospiraceae bacterium]|nr:LysR family transcriptional regulator [Oscillospiraceae bacterium]
MDIYNIKHILVLAEELNYSRAAEKLYITQSTLSQEIKRLESEFGFQLFERNTKKVSLTDNGKQFVNLAKPIDDTFEELQNWITQTRKSNSLKITFGASSITMPHIVNHIQNFASRNPNVVFEYVEQWDPALLTMVADGTVDIALIVIPEEKSTKQGVKYFPINEQYACAVVSNNHKFYGRKSISLENLLEDDLVTTSINSGLSNYLKEKLTAMGMKPHFLINTANMQARLSMVRNGAVTFVFDKQFFIYNSNEFSVIPLEPEIKFVYTIVASAKKKFSSLEKEFLKILKEGLDNDYYL